MNIHEAPLETLVEKVGDYSKTSLALCKLTAIDKFADLLSSLAVQIIVYSILILAVLIVNIGMALWIGELLGKTYFGFFVIAACYAVLAFVLHIFRLNWIKYPINNAIIAKLLSSEKA
ncbi:hypothetical protein [Arcicella rigui]|uniref:Uncharacterized protein n=1 Tax=Arcicella rigui TaxID=797020 RepID=A0ABU5Q8E2_9BACT|nr:hypothetical protein [Arcicella rigui]MEA5139116.1 hypothetical protein [Arcicella rigui]